MSIVLPHGSPELLPRLLTGQERLDELERAKSLPEVRMTSRETSDLIMMGIGAFTPLSGFMGEEDWRRVCRDMSLANGTFWPIPITLSTDRERASALRLHSSVRLVDDETGEILGTMTVDEKYGIDRAFECDHVFRTNDPEHPGVRKVLDQAEVNLAGAVRVLSESYYPTLFQGVYMRPAESRALFEKRGWKTIAALQLRNPMHRSHEYLAKIAIEVCDGLFIHQLVGKLKEGDIPAEVRVRAVDTLIEKYFVPNTCIQAGYPMEMRYGGPREALLHAVFRQNFGCSHLIVGRDHAGVGNYYGPFDAQKIFDEIPAGALLLRPLKIDWTWYCHKCRGMASARTCPHPAEDRLMVSGTMVRKTLSEGGELPPDFSRPEVLEILKDYYQKLDAKVEIKVHGHATGAALSSRGS